MFGITSETILAALSNEITLGLFLLSFASIVIGASVLIGRSLWAILKKRFIVSTQVTNLDGEGFFNTAIWLSTRDFGKRMKSIRAHRTNKDGVDDVVHIYPGDGTHYFFYRGRIVFLRIDLEYEKGARKETFRFDMIDFSNKTMIEMLHEMTVRQDDNTQIRIYQYRWNWSSNIMRNKRNLDSVFYKDDVHLDIINDVRAFINAKEKYAEYGVPYRRGYLLSGPPGTGKTTILHVLASIFDRDIYVVDLSTIDDPSDLADAMGSVKANSFILFEDVDSFAATRKRESDDEGVESGEKSINISTLLNALDGVASPEGLITFFTSNHPDKLDPALLRNGRIGSHHHIGFPDDKCIRDAYIRFSGTHEGSFEFVKSMRGKPMCDVQEELMKRFF